MKKYASSGIPVKLPFCAMGSRIEEGKKKFICRKSGLEIIAVACTRVKDGKPCDNYKLMTVHVRKNDIGK